MALRQSEPFRWEQWVLGIVKVSSTVRHARKVVEAMGEQFIPLMVERDRYRAALTELVTLKDGPRDEDYERRKPLAWQAARDALALDDLKGQESDG